MCMQSTQSSLSSLKLPLLGIYLLYLRLDCRWKYVWKVHQKGCCCAAAGAVIHNVGSL